MPSIRCTQTVVVLILFLLLAIGITDPLWLHLHTAVPSDIGDPLLNAWTLAWDTHALLNQPQHLFDANIFFPLPNTLAYSEHLLATALLAMPLQVASGQPLLAYNITLLVSFALCGLGMYLLCLRWTGGRTAALIAGLAYAFAPYRLASISHLQLLTVQWLPFSVLALDQLLDRIGQGSKGASFSEREHGSTWKAVMLFALFTVLQMLSSWYLAVFTALVLILYLLAWTRRYGWRRMFRALPWLFSGGVIVVLVVIPAAIPYLQVLPHLEATRPAEMVSSLGARPSDFLAAAPWMRLAGPLSEKYRQRPGFTEEHMLYPGLLVALLALVSVFLLAYGAITQKRYLVTHWRVGLFILMLVIALLLTVDGPYRELAYLLPSLRVIRVPARWMVVATFAMAGLVGYTLAQLQEYRKSWLCLLWNMVRCPVPQTISSASCARVFTLAGHTLRYVIPTLIAIGIYAESFAAPLPLAYVGTAEEMSPVYRALGRFILSGEEWRGAVLELPMYVAPAPEYPEAKRMLASHLGWWPLVNGYSGLTPTRQMELGMRLAAFPSAEAIAAVRELGRLGVRYLVIHTTEAPFDHSRWLATERYVVERTTTLFPLGDFAHDILYLINPHGDSLIGDLDRIQDPFWRKRLPVRLNAAFDAEGATLHLLAYRLDEVPPEATPQAPWAHAMRLTLYWQAPRTPTKSYTVFVHALDRTGVLVGQADGLPVGSQYPTNLWYPGEIVQDSRLVPGDYALRIGLYDAATDQRLPAFGADGKRLEHDSVFILIGAR
ncbi:MAG: hypothetical protein ACP5R2_02530 [Anaerolineae bacterium]